MEHTRLIIWDWNGTILNDVQVCIDSINIMLTKRNMPTLEFSQYRKLFTFPVKEYYKKIGFDFKRESFDVLAVEYIQHYLEMAKSAQLNEHSSDVLNFFKNKGYDQIVLSAMEQNALESQINEHNVSGYFSSIIGLNNIHAQSKIDNAKNHFNENPDFSAENTLLIGDTYHDFEVSKVLNCKCVLINNGHQLLNKNSIYGTIDIFDSLSDLFNMMTFNDSLL